MQGPSRLLPEKRLLFVHRAHPSPCPLCDERAKKRYGQDINVIHAGSDLLLFLEYHEDKGKLLGRFMHLEAEALEITSG